MSTLYYFAYGSNLHPQRLLVRVPSAQFLCIAQLTAHRLRFHKRGRDGSGKCNACYTGIAGDRVIGVVYAMDADHKSNLDAAEQGYRTERFMLSAQEGLIGAFTYLSETNHIHESLVPFTWYKELVLEGARYHGLPARYIRDIELLQATDDPDEHRAQAARSMLGVINGAVLA